jgi:hypothetical protein
MEMPRQAPAQTSLRYLPADRVKCGEYRFEQLAVKNASAEPIGDLDGFIVDPPARKVRFAVVHPRGMFATRRLVPVPGVRFDPSRDALLVDASISRCEPFDASRFPEFSDEDVMTAVFAA